MTPVSTPLGVPSCASPLLISCILLSRLYSAGRACVPWRQAREGAAFTLCLACRHISTLLFGTLGGRTLPSLLAFVALCFGQNRSGQRGACHTLLAPAIISAARAGAQCYCRMFRRFLSILWTLPA